MSILHASRAPWIMLVVFGAAALGLFLLTAGGDLELVGDTRPAEEITAVTREVRMPIVIQKYESVKEEIKEEVEKKLHKAGPTETAKPAPREAAAEVSIEKPVEANPALQPEMDPPAGDTGPRALLSHRFKLTVEGFESSFRTDKPVARTHIFFKSSPALWVVDLPGTWTNRARRVSTVAQGPIEKVTIGEHEAFLRIVFRCRDRNQPRPAIIPVVTEEESGFRVVIPAPPEKTDGR